MHPALTHLPRESLGILETSVRPKFNAYFAFTKDLRRAVSNNPQGWFIYPDSSVMSDLTILGSLFGEIDQAFKEHSTRSDFAAALAGDANLREDFRQIVEGNADQRANGSFWITGLGGLEKVSADDTIQHHLERCYGHFATGSRISTGVTTTSPRWIIGTLRIGRHRGRPSRLTSTIGQRRTT
jgi:hypothetical protein